MPIVKDIDLTVKVHFFPILKTVYNNGNVSLGTDYKGKEIAGFVFDNGGDRFDVNFEDIFILKNPTYVKQSACYAGHKLSGFDVKGVILHGE